jgi:hypothetical protein
MKQVSKVVQKQVKVGGHDWGNMIEEICAEESKPKKKGDVFCAPRPHENWKGNRRTKTKSRLGGGGYKPEIFAPINKMIK